MTTSMLMSFDTTCSRHLVLLYVIYDILQRLDADRSGLTKMKKSVKALHNAGKSKSCEKSIC